MKVVVDSSVAIKWALPEPGSPEARRLVIDATLLAPDFIYLEIGNVLWREVRRSALGQSDADAAFLLIRGTPLSVTPTLDLVDEAQPVAAAIDRTLYDSVYVALAQREVAELATADRRLAEAVEASGLGIGVIRIGIS